MSYQQQPNPFMTTVRSIDTTTKINYDKTREFFMTLRTITPLSNPLKVKGDDNKIATVYANAMCEYIFHLSRINREENNNMFDSHSNIEIRKTYIKGIAEFAKVFPTNAFDSFSL